MIKGINRQMIEVTHTGSPYFERAYLVIRPHTSEPSADTLECIARRVVQQADSYAGLRQQRRRRRWRYAAVCVAAGIIGAAAMWVAMQLI